MKYHYTIDEITVIDKSVWGDLQDGKLEDASKYIFVIPSQYTYISQRMRVRNETKGGERGNSEKS